MSAAISTARLGITGVNTHPLHAATLRIAGAQDGAGRQHGPTAPGAPTAAGGRLGDRAATACWAHAAYPAEVPTDLLSVAVATFDWPLTLPPSSRS
jgi:hypothetical protein